MREVLFRGKMKSDNGESKKGSWVFGHYCELTDGKKIIPCIYKKGEVIKDTVGQYTGLTDKNGKKIFEGDIVKHYNNSDDGFDIGTLYWDETFLQWKRTSIGNFHDSSFTYMMSCSCEYEVIGNIHDNPELLKGGER